VATKPLHSLHSLVGQIQAGKKSSYDYGFRVNVVLLRTKPEVKVWYKKYVFILIVIAILTKKQKSRLLLKLGIGNLRDYRY
jgi:hypothetical protein